MEKQRFWPVGIISLIVAALLLILGTFFKSYISNYHLGIMIVCVGLGLILGAFGAVATVKIPIQGITVAGSAALSLILFTYLNDKIEQKYLKVDISYNKKIKTIENMQLFSEEEYPVSRIRDRKLFRFIILDPSITRSHLSLEITNTNQEYPVSFDCIDSGFFTPHLSSGTTVVLYYDEEKEILIDRNSSKVLSNRGGCAVQENVVASKGKFKESISSKLEFSFFTKANAQPPSLQNQNSTEELIKSLDSDNSYERRVARTKLAEQGEASAKPLIEIFINENRNGERNRLKIGTLVALAEMSRENETAEKVSTIVDDYFINELIDSVNDEDKTIRIYSTELLSLIDHPRITQTAIEKFKEASPNGKYNYALLIRNKAQTLPEDERLLILSEVEKLKSELTPKTNVILNQISE